MLTVDAGGTKDGDSGPGLPPSGPRRRGFRETHGAWLASDNRLQLLHRTVSGPPDELSPGLLYGLTMLLIAPIRPTQRDVLPAVVHVDGSARVQTVDAAAEPRLAALLEAFAAIAGPPVLLSTSFNRSGEPIVETPAHALDLLGATDLDAVVLGDTWVEKTGRASR